METTIETLSNIYQKDYMKCTSAIKPKSIVSGK